jgi:hypothetical protein
VSDDGAHRLIYCPHCGKIAATVLIMTAEKSAEANGEYVMAAEAIAMLSKPIDAHSWPGRLRNMFTNHQVYRGDGHYVDAPIKTFGDLCALSELDLIRQPNISRKSVNHVKEVLASYGLHLARYP